MPRLMSNPEYRSVQWNHRFDSHVAPINHLVDELMSSGDFAPYVAPIYGGIHARLLSLLRDPGPKTRRGKGSGFLSMENDDPTAERISNLFSSAAIGAREIVPWNVYPWYINRQPSREELIRGLEPLRKLLDLTPHVVVVMLQGGDAKRGWRLFASRHGDLLEQRKFKVIETYHTSRQAFWHRDPSVRQARLRDLETSFLEASRYLGINNSQ